MKGLQLIVTAGLSESLLEYAKGRALLAMQDAGVKEVCVEQEAPNDFGQYTINYWGEADD